jgi:hypothetical protein
VPTQQVSCDGTLEYFYIPRGGTEDLDEFWHGTLEYFYIPRGGTEDLDEFWRGIDQNRPTKFPTTAFSDKSHSNSKKVKTKKNKMMGWIENGP